MRRLQSGACSLSADRNREASARWRLHIYICAVVFSIGATASVLYREITCWWEVPLYKQWL